MSDTKSEMRSGVQVIARAAAVLRTLKARPAGMSLGQIAGELGLPRSTVQRIVGALQQERLVMTGGDGVRLGPELTALAGAARYDIVERCRPYLADLAARTGETADLSVLRGARMIFLDQVEGTARLRAVSAVGAVFPLTTTANGRACLAALPDAQMLRLAQGEGSPLPPGFLDAIATARDTGLAWDLDDHSDGISAIGFAFRDGADDLHAISVPIPSSRFAEKRAEVAAALSSLRLELQRVLGR